MAYKIEVHKRRHRSSPALRAKAKSELEECKARNTEINSAIKNREKWFRPLLAASRFVVDVNGDPPSIDQLREAVDEAERQLALGDEGRELQKRMDVLRVDVHYHQYTAGHVAAGGMPFLIVTGEGDTREAALAQAQEVKRLNND